MSEVEIKLAKDENGASVLEFLLTKEDIEHLRALKDLPQWRVYRKVLMAAKEGYFQAVLPIVETNPIMKTIGMVTGLNFAINQLPLLVQVHDLQEKKRKLAEEKKEGKKPSKSLS